MKQNNIYIALACMLLGAGLCVGSCVNQPDPLEGAEAPSVDMTGLKVQKMVSVVVEPLQMWTEADAIALAQMAWGEARGCTRIGQAQTMWCVLNRVDKWGGTPLSQCNASGQFYGYSANNPVTDELYELAVDVLMRWEAEHSGESVYRELPHEYLWFTGDGVSNYFREEY